MDVRPVLYLVLLWGWRQRRAEVQPVIGPYWAVPDRI